MVGLRNGTKLHLEENLMTELKDDAFLPMLEDLGEKGRIFLSSNPIQCDSWLALSLNVPKYLQRLQGVNCRSYGGRSEFYMLGNSAVQHLPERVFGNMTFDDIIISETSLVSVDPMALLSSKNRLKILIISNSTLEEFPFQVIPQMTNLTILEITDSPLKSLPALRSSSLEIVRLSHNRIGRLLPGWFMPKLRKLDISNNPIPEIPRGLLEGFRNLTSFDASHCNLGPTLSNGSLVFHSKDLSNVSLRFNGIVRLEPGAIAGLTRNTLVDLSGNNITRLTEDTFRPMLQFLSQQKSGIIISLSQFHGCLLFLTMDLHVVDQDYGSAT
ncbi:unnamed protein product [Darwinula stevensoni]|uniref:Toll-like receptor 2 n=1 Tax=Darwinula stevensoni TaxID=69355 RepID=A0A7R9FS26_9CRUS|nr:unnamed protein product [Darwinula stevensoni]CAG0902643.1 unnamed protein product [Darwinula stevensoni]